MLYEYTRNYKDPVDLYGYTYVDNGPKQIVVDHADETGTRSGFKVENWQELVRQGLNASSPYSLDRTKLLKRVDGSSSQVVQKNVWPFDTHVQVFYGVPVYFGKPVHLAGSHVESDSVALSKLYKKLQSERQQWAGASFAAEAMDVLRQFGRPLGGLMALHDRWRRRVHSNQKHLRAVRYDSPAWRDIVSDLWLEYSFGLGPLMSDTADLADALARFVHEKELNQKLRARIRSRGVSVQTAISDWPWQGCGNINLQVKPQIVTRTEYRTQYVCGLQGDIRAPFGSIQRLQELCGFNAAAWVPGIWEAVPWSWLVDYFFNVGNILSAAVTPTDRVAWICKTDTVQTVQKVSFSGDFRIPPGGWSRLEMRLGGFGFYSLQRTSVTRTIPVKLFVPPLYFKNPFGDLKKMANLAAVFLSGKGDTAHTLGLGPRGLG
jgi:hypothetical protein